MNELKKVMDHIVSCIEKTDITAIYAYPQRKIDRSLKTCAVLSLKGADAKDSGFYRYLGEKYCPDTDTKTELYGKKLEYALKVTLFSEKGPESDDGIYDALMKLLGAVTSSDAVSVSGMAWSDTEYNERFKMYEINGEINCTSFFCAEKKEDEAYFTDFILRGEHKW